MPTYRFPILLAEDYGGAVTAAVVDRDVVAVASTADEALGQVRELLAWQFKEGTLEKPDFLEPSLITFKVEVRPEYRIEKKIFPVAERIPLRVTCVRGQLEGGLRVCSIPLFGLRFYYDDERALRDMVRHYLGEGLKEATPRALSRFLPTKSARLDELVLHLNAAPRQVREEAHLPTLTAVAEPLGERAARRALGRAWEREAELADLERRLQAERANVILVGEAGAGKSTLLAEAAVRVERVFAGRDAAERDDDAAAWQHSARRYWRTSGARIVAGMRYLGEWQKRCEALIEDLASIGGVLCVESLRELFEAAGRDEGAGLAAFLAPYVQRGELRMVAEATPAELDACRRLLPGFVDLFQVVRVPTLDRTRALSVLARLSATLERDTRAAAGDGVTELVYRLFARFIPYQAFPGQTVAFMRDIFDRAAADGESTVTVERAVAAFVRQTGLPELFLRDDVPLAYDDAMAAFSAEVMGQPDACRAATSVVTTFKAGLHDPGRPLGVLLFSGPTGVGKTELAKALARYLFGHGERGERLVRLDMSEYGGPGAARRLVEAPDGGPSEFVKRMRQEPFSVVLFDEVEKASDEVFDVLLSVFDEGRLADPYGRVTTFRSAILVLTSNLGASRGRTPGFGEDGVPAYDTEAREFFRPEFYNRLDAIVTFRPLDRHLVAAIVEKELREVARREGIAKARLRLAWTPRLVDLVAREGFDARYGARPLQRAIEALVVTPLARFLLEHPWVESTTVVVDVGDSGVVVSI